MDKNSTQKLPTIDALHEALENDNRETAKIVIANLHPSEILLHGYAGRPSSTAQTPLDIVCFCIFSIRRHAGSQKTSPKETIELPQSLKAYIETESSRG